MIRHPSSPRALLSSATLRRALVALLWFAAALHLGLAPAHFEESKLMGAGFAAAAVVEFGLGLAALFRPMRLVYIAIIAVAGGLIGLYAYNVVVGLPFGASDREPAAREDHGHLEDAADADHSSDGGGHHGDGLVVGNGEPIDALGATTKLTEMAAIGVSITLLTRRRRA